VTAPDRPPPAVPAPRIPWTDPGAPTDDLTASPLPGPQLAGESTSQDTADHRGPEPDLDPDPDPDLGLDLGLDLDQRIALFPRPTADPRTAAPAPSAEVAANGSAVVTRLRLRIPWPRRRHARPVLLAGEPAPRVTSVTDSGTVPVLTSGLHGADEPLGGPWTGLGGGPPDLEGWPAEVVQPDRGSAAAGESGSEGEPGCPGELRPEDEPGSEGELWSESEPGSDPVALSRPRLPVTPVAVTITPRQGRLGAKFRSR
jgi:hypothetical protein